MRRGALATAQLLLMAALVAFTSPRVSPPVHCAAVQTGNDLIALEALPRANEVICVGDGNLEFCPGTGRGGTMYGFQPASMYVYKDMFNIKNNVSKPVRVWYTLEGALDDWHQHTDGCTFRESMFTVACGSQELEWLPGPEHKVDVAADGVLGPVHFYFEIPSQYSLGEYTGAFIVYAELPEDENRDAGDEDDDEEEDKPGEPDEPEELGERGQPEEPEGPGGSEQPREPGESKGLEQPQEPGKPQGPGNLEEPERLGKVTGGEEQPKLTRERAKGDLPFTGGSETAVTLLGLMLVGVGLWFRRRG